MTLIKRHQPDFQSISNWIEDIFSKDLDMFSKARFTVPSVNIKELEDSYKIELAAPGLKKEDFNINLDNNILTISAEVGDEVEDKNLKYTKREFCYSEFKRSFTLPDSVDSDKVSANYEAGVLTISILKRDEAKVKPKRKIEIS